MVKDIEEMLKVLKSLGVKSAEITQHHHISKVEFFPSSDEIEKRSKAEEDTDAKVNPATGLTRGQSRDLLGMDE